MKAWSRRRLLGLPMVVVFLVVPAGAAAAQSQSADQRLADTYAPIAMLREQQNPPCDAQEEQYQPTSVETVLGNPSVTLKRFVDGSGLEAIKKAPTEDDIAGLGENHYLDLHGTPLGKTCVYAKDFAKLVKAGKAPVVVYARIGREADREGFALQYWFFWYFNQFNDLHEGDWEGMQLTFDADTPEQALSTEPSEIILFQHAGGERADWEDAKVQKRGTHPVVYPAAGSHATFYDSAVYVENGQHGSGLGCDNTTAPLREVAPRPLLIPSVPSRQSGFKWLTYHGHWGEREKGFNNGPTGPVTKTVWGEPFTWMEGQRTTSPRLPGGSVAGPQVTGAFCGAVAGASDLLNLDARSRPKLIATLLALAIALGLFLGTTRWRPAGLEPLRARRAFGQLVRAARQFYGHYWRVLLPIAILAIPILGVANLLSGLLETGNAASDAAGRSGVNLAVADLVETVARPMASAIVAAFVIVFVREIDAARRAGLRHAVEGVRERFWQVVAARLLATLGVTLMAFTVIGFPFAVWKLVGWNFVQQEVLFTDKSLRDAFRGSSDVVRGRWWRAARVIAFFELVTLVTGPVLTFALIFTTLSLVWVNLIGSLIFALLVPYVAVGNTLLYFDLQARAEAEPVTPRGRWRPWRPRASTSGDPQAGAPGPSPRPARGRA